MGAWLALLIATPIDTLQVRRVELADLDEPLDHVLGCPEQVGERAPAEGPQRGSSTAPPDAPVWSQAATLWCVFTQRYASSFVGHEKQ